MLYSPSVTRILSIVGAVVVLFAIFFLIPHGRTPENSNSATPPMAKKTIPPFSPNTPAPGVVKISPSPLRPSSEEELPDVIPPGTVKFHVQEGLAVAMGDLILGTPDDPTTSSGSYSMPNVEYWKTPEIPYLIDQGFPDPERVTQALQHIQAKTGFQFVPYTGQPDGVVFKVGKKDCLSPLGRQGGVQPIKLDNECGWNEIAHEVMHTMGFIHEQSRSDRDKFVEVLYPNIEADFRDQFDILPEDFLGPVKDTAFDYRSIMLYDTSVFSKAGQPTIRSKTGEAIQPSKNGLSPSDIHRVKSFYSLHNR